MSQTKCTDCKFFKQSLYVKSEKNPDSRCVHYSAMLAKDEFDDKGKQVGFRSYKTVGEARMELTPKNPRNEHQIVAWGPHCGPEGTFFATRG